MTRAGDLIVAKTDPPLLSIIAHAAAVLKRARLINWMQDVYPEVASALGLRALGGAFGRLIVAWRNLTLRAAHTNVVLGERMAAHICASAGQTSKIRVIANWSDELDITPIMHSDNVLRQQWGLEGKFVIGYSGNLGRAHEYETMFSAARELMSDSRVVFLMVGGGHHTEALKAAAASAGITNILFKPYQPKEALSACLSAADIHWISLLPALEGLIVPSKAYGILAAGRPILAVTDADGEIARLVRDHGCGFHVAPGDHLAFAEVVRTLASEPSRAQALGAAARAAATGPYSRSNALSKWRQTVMDGVA
jgi:glycosyltransferase involved in cell wall biosynthesis